MKVEYVSLLFFVRFPFRLLPPIICPLLLQIDVSSDERPGRTTQGEMLLMLLGSSSPPLPLENVATLFSFLFCLNR